MSITDRSKWLADFYSGKPIYLTMVYYPPNDIDSISNAYESVEAAQLEVEWAREHNHPIPRIAPLYIHTVELALRRWGPHEN